MANLAGETGLVPVLKNHNTETAHQKETNQRHENQQCPLRKLQTRPTPNTGRDTTPCQGS